MSSTLKIWGPISLLAVVMFASIIQAGLDHDRLQREVTELQRRHQDADHAQQVELTQLRQQLYGNLPAKSFTYDNKGLAQRVALLEAQLKTQQSQLRMAEVQASSLLAHLQRLEK